VRLVPPDREPPFPLGPNAATTGLPPLPLSPRGWRDRNVRPLPESAGRRGSSWNRRRRRPPGPSVTARGTGTPERRTVRGGRRGAAFGRVGRPRPVRERLVPDRLAARLPADGLARAVDRRIVQREGNATVRTIAMKYDNEAGRAARRRGLSGGAGRGRTGGLARGGDGQICWRRGPRPIGRGRPGPGRAKGCSRRTGRRRRSGRRPRRSAAGRSRPRRSGSPTASADRPTGKLPPDGTGDPARPLRASSAVGRTGYDEVAEGVRAVSREFDIQVPTRVVCGFRQAVGPRGVVRRGPDGSRRVVRTGGYAADAGRGRPRAVAY